VRPQQDVNQVGVVGGVIRNDGVEYLEPGTMVQMMYPWWFSTTYMKNKSLGWPSSASKNLGFANELKSWSKRVAELAFKDLKYGAELDRAMISAGYIEFIEPDVVAIMW
jgi:hypothetical protein